MALTDRDRVEISARRAPLGGRTAGPREVLDLVRRASLARSVDDMRRLYAPDAVHEFPFAPAGVPTRLEGRDAIVDWIAAGWRAGTLTYHRYRTRAVHDTRDPDTIVVEQDAIGTSVHTGDVVLPNIVVLTTRNGLIAHLRDYVDVLAAASAVGHDLVS